MNRLLFEVRRLWERLPAPLGLLACFVWGAMIGLFLHYVFYRVSLPVEPFIYAAF
jgi:hypothetical protein